TVREVFGNEKVAITFVGDANNVAFSLFEIMLKFGHNCRFASPASYSFSEERTMYLNNLAKQYGGEMLFTHNPIEAVENTNVIYADVFVSMGEEAMFEQKIRAFSNFQVNKNLFSYATKNPIFMHCLPAHRGVEVTDEIMDSKQSVIYQQAKNRMVVSKGVFTTLIR
ncbi:MAG: ornithine carbamoyltransferase, partial [Chitinophagaceae bacterium]